MRKKFNDKPPLVNPTPGKEIFESFGAGTPSHVDAYPVVVKDTTVKILTSRNGWLGLYDTIVPLNVGRNLPDGNHMGYPVKIVK